MKAGNIQGYHGASGAIPLEVFFRDWYIPSIHAGKQEEQLTLIGEVLRAAAHGCDAKSKVICTCKGSC